MQSVCIQNLNLCHRATAQLFYVNLFVIALFDLFVFSSLYCVVFSLFACTQTCHVSTSPQEADMSVVGSELPVTHGHFQDQRYHFWFRNKSMPSFQQYKTNNYKTGHHISVSDDAPINLSFQKSLSNRNTFSNNKSEHRSLNGDKVESVGLIDSNNFSRAGSVLIDRRVGRLLLGCSRVEVNLIG